MAGTEPIKGYRASLLHFTGDPQLDSDAAVYIEDGLLRVLRGRIVDALPYASHSPQTIAATQIQEYPHHLIMPGFIDCHTHYPQLEMIASYGKELLDWLTTHTFPSEIRFASKSHAETMAEMFLAQMLQHGTTTAMVFTTVHPHSVDALFAAARTRQLRLVAGKMLMDRNAPDALCDDAGGGCADADALIKTWHGEERLQYAITPRFAPTSSPQQLSATGKLLGDHPTVPLHTHLSENTEELAWVKQLFPGSKNYLDVYAQYGLVTSRSVFAHGIHLSDGEAEQLAENNASLVFCPSANLFLGSGLFPYQKLRQRRINIGVGTDIGAGTSLSLLQTLADGYKVTQLQRWCMNPLEAFYHATLGGARVLGLDTWIGNFCPGKEADFVVLDLEANDILRMRLSRPQSLEQRLFALQLLGDRQQVAATFILGQEAYSAGVPSHAAVKAS